MVKIGPVVLEKKMLTDDGRTKHDDGRQPVAIGHLSDSGDLKIITILIQCLCIRLPFMFLEKYIKIRMGFSNKAVNDGSCFFPVLHYDTHIRENCRRYMDETLPYGVKFYPINQSGKFCFTVRVAITECFNITSLVCIFALEI